MRFDVRLHRIIGLLVMVSGFAALIAWWLQVGVSASSVASTVPTLKPNTALGFLLLGTALATDSASRDTTHWMRKRVFAGLGAGILASLLGLLTLVEYAVGLNFGIDQLFLSGALSSDTLVGWGRMSPATAIEFTVIGISCCLILRGRLTRLAQALFISALIFAGFPLVADLYHGTQGWVRFGVYMGMSTPTALLFVLVTIGALAVRPASGVLRRLSGTGLGAKSARYLFPVLVVTLLVLGKLLVSGVNAGIVEPELGTAGLMLAIIVAIGIVLWWHAGQLNQLEIERDRFFLTSADLFCIADFDGNFLRVNPAFTQVLGWSSDELLSRPFFSFVHPDDLEATQAIANKIASGESATHFENRYRCKDGSWRWLSWASTPVFAEQRMYASARDVTELREVQDELVKSEQNLSVTLDSIGDGVITTDPFGVISLLNPVAADLTGWTANEAVGHPVADVFRIINEETRQPAVIPIMEVLRTGEIHGLANHTVLIARDGTERPVSDSAAPIRDLATGEILGVVLVFHDDTVEREAARRMQQMNETLEATVQERTKALRETQWQFESLFAFAPDATILTDASGVIVRINHQAERIFGWAESELVGQAVEVLMPEASRGRHVSHRRDYVQNPVPRQVTGEMSELLALRRDGTTFPVAISLSPIESPEGTLMAASVRDLTGQQELEAKLRQSQKMEAIGLLAGGVAHDFNNILTVINGYAELLSAGLPAESPFLVEVAAINDAGQRAAALTGQLLTFSRQQVLEPMDLNPNQVVADISTMLKRLIGAHITLHTNVRDDGLIRVDSNRLGEAVMNLAINARDAMPNGGHLTIETASVEFDQDYVLHHPEVQPGSWFMVAVSDSGAGMDAQTKVRAFDPFFTTKDHGKGTGMGLAMVHGFVKQSGGHIGLYSEQGKGTTIKLYFPRIGSHDSGKDLGSTVEAAPLRGVETILLIEDEDAVRMVARLTLEGLGYQVIEAESGLAGIEAARQHEGPIELILTDLVMPGIDGVETEKAIRALRPESRVIFMSGYTPDVAVRHGVFDATLDFVQKPFTTRRLAAKIREVLER